MSIYLVRHAEKAKGEYYTPALPMNNQPISEFGVQQAEWLANYFFNIQIGDIRISEYIRTYQTISKVALLKEIKPIKDFRLNEINVGDTEKLNDVEIRAKYPDFWEAYLKRDSDFRFPNGESGNEAGKRIFELFGELSTSNNSILVAHDGIIRILICIILGLPTYMRHKFKIDLASVTICDYDDELRCWRLNQINHHE